MVRAEVARQNHGTTAIEDGRHGGAIGGRWRHEPEPGALRLWAARKRRGLPVYRAHEALSDALACAELYLAQRAELEARHPGTTQTLRQVVA